MTLQLVAMSGTLNRHLGLDPRPSLTRCLGELGVEFTHHERVMGEVRAEISEFL